MIRHLERIAAITGLIAASIGCVVLHTKEVVLIEPSYSHAHDQAPPVPAVVPPSISADDERVDHQRAGKPAAPVVGAPVSQLTAPR